jgi:hypothetical protein
MPTSVSDATNSFTDRSLYAKYKDAYSDSDCMLIHTTLLSEEENVSKQLRKTYFLSIWKFQICELISFN